MGRAACCSKVGLHRGQWTKREDNVLINYIQTHGEGHWRSLPIRAGLMRCGKSCRLRWMNYLRPDIKRGNITPDEEDLIIRLHSLLGNRWSLIAGRLPGRTDNEIKNYWNSHLRKKLLINNHKSSPTAAKCISERKSTNAKDNDKKKKRNNVVNNSGSSTGRYSQSSDNDPVPRSYQSLNVVNDHSSGRHSACEKSRSRSDGDNWLLEDIFDEYQGLLLPAENAAEFDSFIESLLA